MAAKVGEFTRSHARFLQELPRPPKAGAQKHVKGGGKFEHGSQASSRSGV